MREERGSPMKVPDTKNVWAKSVLEVGGEERYTLINNRPVVTWFSTVKLDVVRLYKVTARLGDDLWIVQGRANEENTDLFMTVAPRSLEVCLRYPTKDNGWILCEFPDELSFVKALLEYFR
jgi:hypothetical protein